MKIWPKSKLQSLTLTMTSTGAKGSRMTTTPSTPNPTKTSQSRSRAVPKQSQTRTHTSTSWKRRASMFPNRQRFRFRKKTIKSSVRARSRSVKASWANLPRNHQNTALPCQQRRKRSKNKRQRSLKKSMKRFVARTTSPPRKRMNAKSSVSTGKATMRPSTSRTRKVV